MKKISEVAKKQWIKMSIVLLLYLLFLVWVKSWLGLIVVPFIIDAFTTRIIKWDWWKQLKNKTLYSIMSWVDAIVFALVAVYFVNIFFFQNYAIPSSLLEKSLLDFAIVEGVFDKSKYDYHLYKKESFVGICSKYHPFANNTVKLEELLNENLVVRESSSGTRALLENAISDRGFSFDSFKRYVSVSNFSVICDLIINNKFITFAYEPISKCREDLAVFTVKDMQIYGEFNFVYCNERIAKEKINLLFRA